MPWFGSRGVLSLGIRSEEPGWTSEGCSLSPVFASTMIVSTRKAALKSPPGFMTLTA